MHQTAAWYPGLTFEERASIAAALTPENIHVGENRIARWQNERRVTGGLAPQLRRWAEAAGSDEALAAIVGCSGPPSVSSNQAPTWWKTIRAVFEAEIQEQSPSLPELYSEVEHAGFQQLFLPLVDHYQRQFTTALARILPPSPESEPTRVSLLRICAPPIELLEQVSAPTLVALMNEQDNLQTRGEDTFSAFAEQLRNHAYSLTIYTRFPALARLHVTILENWLNSRIEMIQRLASDEATIKAAFNLPRHSLLHDVRAVKFGVGDTHESGRSVAVLTFRGGKQIVYKPRPLALEKIFNETIETVNTRLREECLSLYAPVILDEGDYGWMEFVTPAPCRDRDEAEQYYCRLGALTALMHAFGAEDIHSENIIAYGEHPVIIDLEASILPPSPLAPRVGVEDSAFTRSEVVRTGSIAMKHSLMMMGLLPQGVANRANGALDMSGLAGRGGRSPMAIPVWEQRGTSQMRLVRRQLTLPPGVNLPNIGGEYTSPGDYVGSFKKGFGSVYKSITESPEIIINPELLDRVAQCVNRIVLRSTMRYGRLLLESTHPDVLRDTLDRQLMFELLSGSSTPPRFPAQIVASEVSQLLNGDIPKFTSRCGSTAIYDHKGKLLANYFETTGVQALVERVQRFSDAALQVHLWTIDASMATIDGFQSRSHATTRPPRKQQEGDTDGVHYPTPLQAAVAAGDRLLASSLKIPTDLGREVPTWLTLGFSEPETWSVAPASLDLYNGSLGIALFLTELSQLPAGDRFLEAVTPLNDALYRSACDIAETSSTSRKVNLGGHGPLGGLIYTLTHLSRLNDNPLLLEPARALAATLHRSIETDDAFDVIGGSAGYAMVLCALYNVDPNPAIRESLQHVAAHLTRFAVRSDEGAYWVTDQTATGPLLGYAHGTAGISAALSRIGAMLSDPEATALAKAAATYEHNSYDPVRQRWPDRRAFESATASLPAWCHGSTGIGIARAELLSHGRLDFALDDLKRSVREITQTATWGTKIRTLGNLSLCHGDCGRLELVVRATEFLSGELPDESVKGYVDQIARDLYSGQPVCGTPGSINVPGLMTGISGIGHTMLRLQYPGRFADFLTLGTTPTGDACR